MKTDKKETYTILSPELKNPETIASFFKTFELNYPKFKNENIIIDLSKGSELNLNDILLFSKINEEHKNNSKSFVIVTDKVSIGELPDELMVTPTLNEAVDVIELEEIERDLGI